MFEDLPPKSNKEQGQPKSLLETSDYLESVGVFRAWKNFLFVIALICLLLLQAAFWVVNTGVVETNGPAAGDKGVVKAEAEKGEDAEPQPVVEPNKAKADANEEEPAARPKPAHAASEDSDSGEDEKQEEAADTKFAAVKFESLESMTGFVNFVLVPVSVLYCLTMLFCLKVSIVGRLGGLKHITRALFISLVFVVLLLPWQLLFGGIFVGAMYTCEELLKAGSSLGEKGSLGTSVVYLRFTGYWLVVVVLLIWAQVRSGRWAKATLRRLEVI